MILVQCCSKWCQCCSCGVSKIATTCFSNAIVFVVKQNNNNNLVQENILFCRFNFIKILNQFVIILLIITTFVTIVPSLIAIVTAFVASVPWSIAIVSGFVAVVSAIISIIVATIAGLGNCRGSRVAVIYQVDVTEVPVTVTTSVVVVVIGRVTGTRRARLIVVVAVRTEDERVLVAVVETVLSALAGVLATVRVHALRVVVGPGIIIGGGGQCH